MSTMNMRPQNILILAALGIGAYWFMTRKAKAATVAPAPYARVATGGNPGAAPPKPNLLNGILAGMDAYLNGTSQAVAQLPASVDANPTNSPSAYSSGGFDPNAINGPW